MRKNMTIVLAFVAMLLLPLALAQKDPRAEAQLQAAINRETVEGDLNGAIEQYKLLAKSPNRFVAAKALLHLGICYEKLGKSEARSAYNRLLKDYGDQTQQAKEARSRLAQLEAAAGGPARANEGLTFRKIDFKEAGNSHQVRLSPDGSKLLYIGGKDSIRVMDFTSGKSHSLVEGINANVANLIFEWSPDGKRVVYKSGRGELRVINAEGGQSEALWASPEKDTAVYPLDWSDRNHTVLIALINRTEKTARLAMLPEKGGEPRTVVSGDPDQLADIAQFSPDGKLIVGMKRKEKNTDVFVWTVDGGDETRVTDHTADDEYPLWFPNGKYIVFVSNRAKTVDLWAVPMAGTRPAGEPVRLHANIGKNKIPLDLTRGGLLTFYAMSSVGGPSDLFVLPVDPATGEAGGAFRPFANYPSGASRWSPDGLRAAYTSRKGNFQLPNAYVGSGGNSEELEIPARGYWMGNIEWSRDGKYLLFPGWNNDDGRVGIFRISMENLTIEPIRAPGEKYGANFEGAYVNLRWLPLAGRYMFAKLLGEAGEELYLMNPVDYQIERVGGEFGISGYGIPSPDGRYLIGISYKEKTIALLSLPDGASRVLCALPPGGYPAFSWSPDGKKLVWNEGQWLKMYSVLEGTIQTLAEAGQSRKFGPGSPMSGTPNTAFSPDGTKIAYVLQDAANGPNSRAELWIVGTTGGASKKIADAPSSHPELGEVAWHPSGKMIFAQGQGAAGTAGVFEHWVMENFLPPPKLSR